MTAPRRGSRTAWAAARMLTHRAGGRAVRVRPDQLLDSFGPIEGLVVLGGVDVDPERYGEPRTPGRRVDPDRDARELELIDVALGGDLPILGICRGAQLLNVARGGSLARIPRRRPRIAFPYRRARLAESSKLRELLGRDRVWINTLHRYAVDRLGDGLSVAAVDSAGLAQAIEVDGPQLAIGVQWHPELIPYARTTRVLFAALVDAARSSS